jgi:hypothetical protein
MIYHAWRGSDRSARVMLLDEVGGARDLAHATIDDASWPALRPSHVSFSTNEAKVVAPCYTLSHTCALPPGGVAVRRRSGRLPLAGDALWCAGSADDVAAADAGRDGVRQHTVATTLMTRVHATPWPHLVDRGDIGGRDSRRSIMRWGDPRLELSDLPATTIAVHSWPARLAVVQRELQKRGFNGAVDWVRLSCSHPGGQIDNPREPRSIPSRVYVARHTRDVTSATPALVSAAVTRRYRRQPRSAAPESLPQR